ncbi:hypothetical protein AGOR_G00117450 [Albula goreensis]|uniref:Uncharacterized protein n=1 Tax=Albula goreensis TaxID=1534307 RepID=A0A8T3DCS5_9TELE|nr:hypothetical protein AGOR_G00117450 [Albula goreensis]
MNESCVLFILSLPPPPTLCTFPCCATSLCVHRPSSSETRSLFIMSVMMVPSISPAEEEPQPQTTEVGGTKPLHRFLKGQPKTIGVVMLFFGGALFIFGIPYNSDASFGGNYSFCPFWMGIMFIICGILYVLSEHSPTKKLVTASLALSIVSTIAVVVALLEFLPDMVAMHSHLYGWDHYGSFYENDTMEISEEHSKNNMLFLMLYTLVFTFYCVLGGVILIVMATFARTALKSTKTQAIVRMHNLPSE